MAGKTTEKEYEVIQADEPVIVIKYGDKLTVASGKQINTEQKKIEDNETLLYNMNPAEIKKQSQKKTLGFFANSAQLVRLPEKVDDGSITFLVNMGTLATLNSKVIKGRTLDINRTKHPVQLAIRAGNAKQLKDHEVIIRGIKEDTKLELITSQFDGKLANGDVTIDSDSDGDNATLIIAGYGRYEFVGKNEGYLKGLIKGSELEDSYKRTIESNTAVPGSEETEENAETGSQTSETPKTPKTPKTEPAKKIPEISVPTISTGGSGNSGKGEKPTKERITVNGKGIKSQDPSTNSKKQDTPAKKPKEQNTSEPEPGPKPKEPEAQSTEVKNGSFTADEKNNLIVITPASFDKEGRVDITNFDPRHDAVVLPKELEDIEGIEYENGAIFIPGHGMIAVSDKNGNKVLPENFLINQNEALADLKYKDTDYVKELAKKIAGDQTNPDQENSEQRNPDQRNSEQTNQKQKGGTMDNTGNGKNISQQDITVVNLPGSESKELTKGEPELVVISDVIRDTEITNFGEEDGIIIDPNLVARINEEDGAIVIFLKNGKKVNLRGEPGQVMTLEQLKAANTRGQSMWQRVYGDYYQERQIASTNPPPTISGEQGAGQGIEKAEEKENFSDKALEVALEILPELLPSLLPLLQGEKVDLSKTLEAVVGFVAKKLVSASIPDKLKENNPIAETVIEATVDTIARIATQPLTSRLFNRNESSSSTVTSADYKDKTIKLPKGSQTIVPEKGSDKIIVVSNFESSEDIIDFTGLGVVVLSSDQLNTSPKRVQLSNQAGEVVAEVRFEKSDINSDLSEAIRITVRLIDDDLDDDRTVNIPFDEYLDQPDKYYSDGIIESSNVTLKPEQQLVILSKESTPQTITLAEMGSSYRLENVNSSDTVNITLKGKDIPTKVELVGNVINVETENGSATISVDNNISENKIFFYAVDSDGKEVRVSLQEFNDNEDSFNQDPEQNGNDEGSITADGTKTEIMLSEGGEPQNVFITRSGLRNNLTITNFSATDQLSFSTIEVDPANISIANGNVVLIKEGNPLASLVTSSIASSITIKNGTIRPSQILFNDDDGSSFTLADFQSDNVETKDDGTETADNENDQTKNQDTQTVDNQNNQTVGDANQGTSTTDQDDQNTQAPATPNVVTQPEQPAQPPVTQPVTEQPANQDTQTPATPNVVTQPVAQPPVTESVTGRKVIQNNDKPTVYNLAQQGSLVLDGNNPSQNITVNGITADNHIIIVNATKVTLQNGALAIFNEAGVSTYQLNPANGGTLENAVFFSDLTNNGAVSPIIDANAISDDGVYTVKDQERAFIANNPNITTAFSDEEKQQVLVVDPASISGNGQQYSIANIIPEEGNSILIVAETVADSQITDGVLKITKNDGSSFNIALQTSNNQSLENVVFLQRENIELDAVPVINSDANVVVNTSATLDNQAIMMTQYLADLDSSDAFSDSQSQNQDRASNNNNNDLIDFMNVA